MTAEAAFFCSSKRRHYGTPLPRRLLSDRPTKESAMPDDRSLNDDPSRKLVRTDLPPTETQQPDPLLQITTGRVHAGGITIAAIVVVVVVVGVVLYGLNSRGTSEATVAPPSTAAARQPAAGGASGAATPAAPRANASGVKG